MYVIVHCLEVLFIFASFSSPFCTSSTGIILTGGNGVLGTALAKEFCQTNLPIAVTFRNEEKFFSTLDRKKFNLDYFSPILLEYPGDFDSSVDFEKSFYSITSSDIWKSLDELILINNIGYFDLSLSKISLLKHVSVNAFWPLMLAKYIRECFSSRLSVINISSGEGENLRLCQFLQDQISSIDSFDEWQIYVRGFTENQNSSCMAHGESPWYCISKALLNKGTACFHNSINNQKTRCLAICPGNFLSPMTTSDEIESVRPINEIVAEIVHYSNDWLKYPGGHFYRHLQHIPW